MILRIGLDFDNTIANYDSAFPRVAETIGIPNSAISKRDLKRELQSQINGEELWQRVQGLTYGQFIHFAELQSGLLEFVIRARAELHEIFIVSHKTEFGHFDESKVSLRDAALEWLRQNHVVGDLPHQVSGENVFFADSQDEKITKISDLHVGVFVDDLEEIFHSEIFPKSTRKFHFSPSVAVNDVVEKFESWREIGNELLGNVTSPQVLFVLQKFWPDFEFLSVEKIDGRGNSKIFKVRSRIDDLVLKIYPDLVFDRRLRRQTEWDATTLLTSFGLQVPKPVRTNQSLNWSLFEWVDGGSGLSQIETNVSRAVDFARQLKDVSEKVSLKESIGFASEFCLTPEEVSRQINLRVELLKKSKNLELNKFLDTDLLPLFLRMTDRAKKILGGAYSEKISSDQWFASPSDFGLHNAIITFDNDIVFHDFEYFGWDDPVKFTADFYFHPAMNLSEGAKEFWINEMKKLFITDAQFEIRLNALMPLFAIRWSLIILNEFNTEKLKNRINAEDRIRTSVQITQENQLKKAKAMLQNVKKWSQSVA